jgi:hypothetical protein
MVRQHGRVPGVLIFGQRLERARSRQMSTGARVIVELRIEHLAYQVVDEAVFACPAGTDDAGRDRGVEQTPAMLGALLAGTSQHRDEQVTAEHCGQTQQRQAVAVEER